MYCSVNVFDPMTIGRDWVVRNGAASGDHRVDDQAGHHAKRVDDPCAATGPNARLDGAHEAVQEQREACGGHTADQHRDVVARLQSTEDVVAQARRPYRRRQRCDAHHPNGRRANPGHDDRHRQRQLHTHQLLPGGHADAAGCFLERRVHTADPGDGVAENREDAVQREAHDRGEKPDALQVDRGQQGHHHREEGQARHRLDRRREPQGQPLEPPHPGRGDPERETERRAEQQGQQRQL